MLHSRGVSKWIFNFRSPNSEFRTRQNLRIPNPIYSWYIANKILGYYPKNTQIKNKI